MLRRLHLKLGCQPDLGCDIRGQGSHIRDISDVGSPWDLGCSGLGLTWIGLARFGIQGMPGMLGMPDMPGIPDMLGTPGMPNMPVGMPGMRGMPACP